MPLPLPIMKLCVMRFREHTPNWNENIEEADIEDDEVTRWHRTDVV
jgi:hypothetical protein